MMADDPTQKLGRGARDALVDPDCCGHGRLDNGDPGVE